MGTDRLPSGRELEILRVLWGMGAATVRDVHRALPSRDEFGYNTVGKLLNIMVQKGLVARDESARAHVYTACVDETETQRSFVDDLTDRVFGGSASALALQALGSQPLSEAEIEELRALIAELEE